MVPWIDTTAGRFRATVWGILLILGGVIWADRVPRYISVGLASLGVVVILWAWLHRSRSGFPARDEERRG